MRRWWVASLASLAVLGLSSESVAAPPDVTLATQNAYAWTTQAVHGGLDDVVPLVAGEGEGKATVVVVVSGASQGGQTEPVLPLHLVSAPTAPDASLGDAFTKGSASANVELEPGQKLGLRIVGTGFNSPGAYRASLSVGGHIYAVRIDVASPLPPLGLQLSEWSQTFAVFPWTRAITASACIPVDASLDATTPIHVVATPLPESGKADPDGRRVPPGSLSARPSPACLDNHAFLLTVGPMKPGRYEETLDVQGEKLKLALSFRAPAYVVILAVLLGAMVSMFLRAFARARREAARTEYEMLDLQRGQRKFALVLDSRRVANALQLARGSSRAFMREDVQRYIDEASRVDVTSSALSPLVDQLESALLPARLRQQLQRDVANLKRLSSLQDRATIVSTLERLRVEAASGFSERVAAWFFKERDIVAARALEAETAAQALPEPRRALVLGLVTSAFTMLGRVIEDAQAVWAHARAGGPPLDPDQLAVVERVEGAIAVLQDALKAGDDAALQQAAVAAMFLDLPRERPTAGETLTIPVFQVVVEREGAGGQTAVRALEDVTLGLSGIRPEVIRQARIEWSVREDEWFEGGPRLTHVFATGAWLATVRVRLRPMNPGQALQAAEGVRVLDGVATAEWTGPVADADSKLRRLRFLSSGADLTVLAVGVVLVGIVATIIGGEKQIGTTSDYVGMLLAGVGVDTTTSSTTLKSLFGLVTRAIDGRTGGGDKKAAAEPASGQETS